MIRGKSWRAFWLVHGLALLLLLLAAAAAWLIGPVPTPPTALLDIWRAPKSETAQIMMLVRLPRVLLALGAGGGLALSGCLLQAVFRNPLVEPFTLGISGGASIGAALVLISGAASLWNGWLPVGGFIGAIAAVSVVLTVSRGAGGSLTSLLLTGVMVSFISGSILLFLFSVADPAAARNILFWTMGSLANGGISAALALLALTALVWAAGLFAAPALNAFTLHAEEAAVLGVPVKQVQWACIISASVLGGMVVSFCGIIGFVGLLVPHTVRLLFGSDHRYVLGLSVVGGALFLLLSDTLARTLWQPSELPVGVISGIIGGVMFIVLMRERRVE